MITSEASPDATATPSMRTVTPDVEPTPVIDYDGKTKTVALGDVKVAATVEAPVIHLVVTASNTTERKLSYSIDVAVSNGETPVYTKTLDIRDIEPGLTKEKSREIDISGYTRTFGEPKVFINDVATSAE
ncbi:hypothetical protein V1J52_04345 [Streptomyces sp. TRM 70351]|uniref:hypothetical protein n=1 Tax=Streptomyces sp. TRM 70351 TaxID=3116552 RepID=UPI002E7C0635|nr:hypothetical protein [Streptomyces sp. TRM 70351]MEE1927420.1 hypothetical protein [Streptomyces sp. TRM 70351]